MPDFLNLAVSNLTSPMVLFFCLGLAAAFARSDLAIPEAVAKTLAIYLMMAIGFKGGVEVSRSGLAGDIVALIVAGALLATLLPAVGYVLLRATSRLSVANAAAVAAHYGSISIVTFVAASQVLQAAGLAFDGALIAVAAVMEMPAIVVALVIARRFSPPAERPASGVSFWREAALNSSIVMLLGSFVIGWVSGEPGLRMIAPLIIDPFSGILSLFLLDMGLIAGRGLARSWRDLKPPVVLFGLYMPLISAAAASAAAMALGLNAGSAALLITLAASASYIAVPAAMRLALPEAQPSIYLTLSIGVTFPFNLTLGIPLYIAIAGYIAAP
ncbi:MAG: sodium-dependent bicarbonate transport family permease [Hyphomicrobiales bacterium]